MSATLSLTQTFGSAAQGWLARFGMRRWNRSQWATYYELMNLSDRQLEDIGIARGMIDGIVDRHVDGRMAARRLAD